MYLNSVFVNFHKKTWLDTYRIRVRVGFASAGLRIGLLESGLPSSAIDIKHRRPKLVRGELGVWKLPVQSRLYDHSGLKYSNRPLY
jgi:hypothetical protein